MTIKVKFFAYFREVFGGRDREVALDPGASVGDALAFLCDTPARRGEIFAAGELKPHLVIMLNGVPVQSLKGTSTPLAAGDTLAVFPMMGGG
jgi:MoaD family protein